MNLRSIGTYAAGVAAILASGTLDSNAKVTGKATSNSAVQVAAEMTRGKLNPAESKPGDTVLLKLNNDLKSNGRVLLKKKTTITGVVRSVTRAEAGAAPTGAQGHAQSMMEIEWLPPVPQGKVTTSLSITLQSVVQLNRIHEQQKAAGSEFGFTGVGKPSPAVARPTPANGRLPVGSVGAVGTPARNAANTVRPPDDIGSTTAAVAPSSTRPSGQPNAALLSMPFVVAVDHETSSTIEGRLGTSSSGQLFKVGRGQLLTATGSQQSVDIFSHLNNDTVITSASKDFEISSGAQLLLLVGVNRNSSK